MSEKNKINKETEEEKIERNASKIPGQRETYLWERINDTEFFRKKEKTISQKIVKGPLRLLLAFGGMAEEVLDLYGRVIPKHVVKKGIEYKNLIQEHERKKNE